MRKKFFAFTIFLFIVLQLTDAKMSAGDYKSTCGNTCGRFVKEGDCDGKSPINTRVTGGDCFCKWENSKCKEDYEKYVQQVLPPVSF
ncbi:hypothetical protein niasHT_018386 [Heterodera trifolii]|uniref:Uncharacterized protein n=1 Tax=Heterodera trifolii TaxID=157864 RepID=A0ABD2LEB4_9BILA